MTQISNAKFNVIKSNKLHSYTDSNIDYIKNLNNINFLSFMDISSVDIIIKKSPINPINQHHTMFITLISNLYFDILKIALNSAFKNNISRSEIVIFSLNKSNHLWCRKNKINSVFFNICSIDRYKSWAAIGRLKQIIQYIFICKLCDTIFFDSDLIFASNVKDELILNINNNFDIQLMNELFIPRKEIDINNAGLYNIGFMIVKSSNSTLYLFKYWLYLCNIPNRNVWDQQVFNNLIHGCKIISRNNISKTITFCNNFGTKMNYIFCIHFLNPLKYLCFCDLKNKDVNDFSLGKISILLSYAREMKIIKPYLVHYACIAGKHKFNFVKNLTLNNQTYHYYMHHLIFYFKLT